MDGLTPSHRHLLLPARHDTAQLSKNEGRKRARPRCHATYVYGYHHPDLCIYNEAVICIIIMPT